jgi:hypothetical protein
LGDDIVDIFDIFDFFDFFDCWKYLKKNYFFELGIKKDLYGKDYVNAVCQAQYRSYINIGI